MDKETLLRLAQPAATFALALSVVTLPITVKAYGDYTINDAVDRIGGDHVIRVWHDNDCAS
mgnify:CR=1 FL=1